MSCVRVWNERKAPLPLGLDSSVLPPIPHEWVVHSTIIHQVTLLVEANSQPAMNFDLDVPDTSCSSLQGIFSSRFVNLSHKFSRFTPGADLGEATVCLFTLLSGSSFLPRSFRAVMINLSVVQFTPCPHWQTAQPMVAIFSVSNSCALFNKDFPQTPALALVSNRGGGSLGTRIMLYNLRPGLHPTLTVVQVQPVPQGNFSVEIGFKKGNKRGRVVPELSGFVDLGDGSYAVDSDTVTRKWDYLSEFQGRRHPPSWPLLVQVHYVIDLGDGSDVVPVYGGLVCVPQQGSATTTANYYQLSPLPQGADENDASVVPLAPPVLEGAGGMKRPAEPLEEQRPTKRLRLDSACDTFESLIDPSMELDSNYESRESDPNLGSCASPQADDFDHDWPHISSGHLFPDETSDTGDEVATGSYNIFNLYEPYLQPSLFDGADDLVPLLCALFLFLT